MARNKKAVAGFAAAAALFSVGAAQAAMITNGSFELGSYTAAGFDTLKGGSTAITGWTVTGAAATNSIDWIGSYWTAADGSRSLDLNGAYQPGGVTLSQNLSLTVGQAYTLKFSMAGNPDRPDLGTLKKLNVTIDNGTSDVSNDYTFDTSGKSKTSMGWVDYSLTFVAAVSNPTLTFSTLIGASDPASAFGPALDNVRLSAVPLPAAVWLFGSAVLGLGLLARRRVQA